MTATASVIFFHFLAFANAGPPDPRRLPPWCPYTVALKARAALGDHKQTYAAETARTRALRDANYALVDIEYFLREGPRPSDGPQLRQLRRDQMAKNLEIPQERLKRIDGPLRNELEKIPHLNAALRAAEQIRKALESNNPGELLWALREAYPVMRAIENSGPPPFDRLSDLELIALANRQADRLNDILRRVLLPEARKRLLFAREEMFKTVLENQVILHALGVPNSDSLVLQVRHFPESDSLRSNVLLINSKPPPSTLRTVIGRFEGSTADDLSIRDEQTGTVQRIPRRLIASAYSGSLEVPDENIKSSIAGIWYVGTAGKQPPFRVIYTAKDSDNTPIVLVEKLGKPFRAQTMEVEEVIHYPWENDGFSVDEEDFYLKPRLEVHRAMQTLPQKLGQSLTQQQKRAIEEMLSTLYSLRNQKSRDYPDPLKIAKAKYAAIFPIYENLPGGPEQFWVDYKAGKFGLQFENNRLDLDNPAIRREITSSRPLQ